MPVVAYSKSYTYDAVGNRLTMTDNLTSAVTTSTYDAANQLEKAVDAGGTTSYTYDAAGNLTTNCRFPTSPKTDTPASPCCTNNRQPNSEHGGNQQGLDRPPSPSPVEAQAERGE